MCTPDESHQATALQRKSPQSREPADSPQKVHGGEDDVFLECVSQFHSGGPFQTQGVHRHPQAPLHMTVEEM